VEEFNLDGVDMDWEYPDDDSSSDDFVALMKPLADSLHARQKELTLAVVSYDGRLSSIGKIAQATGIKREIFDIVDWVNIMAYDDENGKVYPDNAHSTYALAEKCLDYWIGERGLPSEKAVLGLPFYAKPGYISYRNLLAQGAEPSADSFKEVFYNGTETIKAKTQLALARNCGGVMIWEISQDVKGENSLVRAINDALAEHQAGGKSSTHSVN
jgi:chitinase